MHTTLVSTQQLADQYPHWRVFDCRHDLAKPDLGAEQYRESHIPGALFASLDRDLSGKKSGRNGRHPLPEPQEFEKWLEKTGLTPKDQVVCYDAGPGAMAARAEPFLYQTPCAYSRLPVRRERDRGHAVTSDDARATPPALNSAADWRAWTAVMGSASPTTGRD